MTWTLRQITVFRKPRLMNKSLKLYSFWACPFAQRAWIAFEKSGLKYEYVELNPYISRENLEWNKDIVSYSDQYIT